MIKWIGQHIWDFVSRFRNDVYLEDLADPGSDTDKFLVVDTNSKVGYRTGAEVLSDIGGSSGGATISNDANDRVTTAMGNGNLNAEANLTWNNIQLGLEYTGSSGPVLLLTKTGDNNTGPTINLASQRAASGGAAGVDGDDLGQLQFFGYNNAGTPEAITFGKILCEIEEADDGDEAGKLSLQVANDGTLRDGLVITGDKGVAEQVDVTIGNGPASTTTIAGFLAVTNGADIDNPALSGKAALIVDNNDIDEIALDIDAANTTANIIDVNAQSLTTGDALFIDSNSLVDGGKLIHVDLDLAGAVDDGFQYGIYLDIDKSGNVASGENNYIYGSQINFDDNGTNVGNSYFYGTVVNITDANDNGTNRRYGYQAYISGGDADKSYGYYSNVANGGYDFYARSSASQFDYATWQTGASGATTISTVDGAGTAAHFEIAADGNITLDPAGTIALEANTTVTGDVTTTGNIELGHASDTTIARSAAGIVAVEGEEVVTTLTRSLTSEGVGVPLALMQARRTLTEAELNDLHNTPITIVPAQGANTVIVPMEAILFVDRDASTAQSANASLLFSWDGNSSYATDALLYSRRFMYNESGDRIFNVKGGYTGEVGTSLTAGTNKPVKAVFDLACTSGSLDSMDVYLTYYVLNIS